MSFVVLACESLHACTVCMWYEWPLLFLAFKAYMYGLCVSGMSVLCPLVVFSL